MANGKLTNGQSLDHILQADADNGRVAVHTFDEKASPAEKAAAAGQASDQLQSVKQKNAPAGLELQLDTGSPGVVPTINIEDADVDEKDLVTATQANGTSLPTAVPDTLEPPGAMPAGAAPTIPDWYTVGWRQASGIDAPPLPEGEEKDKRILDLFISEQFYGSWYHNAALIVFAVFASHFLTRFSFGFGWLFILLAVCNTYYSTSMERVKRNARDDIQRELVKTRLDSEHESADWMNNFLDRFWLIYEPVLSATIVNSVDQILSTNTPAFLDSIRLTDFTLGTKAPHIDKVRTFPRTADDIVLMDWGLSFTPNDISEMTPKQAAAKVNPKIVLSIRLGKGLATASMPILLEDISFSGLMRIRLKLMSNFPHVQIVDLSFLEKPVIDYVLKPVGGDTFGIDIANIPGLSTFIRDMTHATLGPMMYDPNVFTLNLEQMLSGAPIDSAIGVLQITVHAARGIKGTKIGGGTPDPFVGISINNRAELARTKYKNNTYNPTWSETKFILVNSLTESLILNLWDYNDHRKNALLGSSSFDLTKLNEDATQEGLVSTILKDGKERGELRYDISFYPVLKAEDGATDVPESSVGIVRLTLHQAKELDNSKSLSGDLNPLAKVFLGNSSAPIYTTKAFKHTNNPIWESSHEFLCADRQSSIITLKVIDDRDFLKDPVIGYMSIKLDDLIHAKKEASRDWFPLSNCKSGKLRLSAEWKPLNMAGSLHGADQYTPPIGVVRLWLDRATDVKNVEAALGGKSDPYVRVQINNETKGRTDVVNNNLNPVWDQIIYIPVHSLRETLLVECMDYQHLTRDRSLGSFDIHVSDLAKESDEPKYPFASTGLRTAVDQLRLDKGNIYKGNLHYTAEFIPALKLKQVKFDAHPNEIQRAAEASEDEDGGYVTDDLSSSDDEAQAVPVGVTIQMPKKKGHIKGALSNETTRTNDSVDTLALLKGGESVEQIEKPSEAGPEFEGIEMSTEELLSQQSGIIVFDVISGQIAKKARLEVLLDDGYWPCFSTARSRSIHAQWEYVGEGFVKELDFGQVWLRLNEADEGDKDAIIAEYKGDAKDFLESTLKGPQTFSLGADDERYTSTVTLEARFIPVPVNLEPRESINNQGTLRVSLLNGRGIHAADRGGKSDPFAVFTLNGQKVHKSQTKKKTLDPEWDEDFICQVPSRVAADFNLELFDWNQIETAKSLGGASIDLASLEPFQSVERELALVSPKHGEKGHVRIRLLFQPEIIARSRKNTSTFSSAGRAMTQIGGLPVSATKGVFHGVTDIFKKGRSSEDDLPETPTTAVAGQASFPLDGRNASSTTFPNLPNRPSVDSMGQAAYQEPGTLRVTVVSGKDLGGGDCKPYTSLRVGDKEFKTKHGGKTATPEWNESFFFAAGPFTAKLYTWVHDHKTIGKDKMLGEAEVDIWRHIKHDSTSSAEVLVELAGGNGRLTLRLEFDPTMNPNANRSSVSSSPAPSDRVISRTLSITNTSRFSLRGRRDKDQDDD